MRLETTMKLPVVLIGEENLAFASLRQHLAKEINFQPDPQVHSFAEAAEVARKKTGPVLVVVDVGRDAERPFAQRKISSGNFPRSICS